MSDANKAVFLSYASQDAEAAKRICEALRAAGVEVWFDQSELVGGDSWDAKIRGQIGSCALFVPLISAATQARREGYFRIEWKLAAQRTHAMADGTPFLLPLLIDGTRDAEALVPAEFRAVQWSKLPHGEASPAFVARVKNLLGGLEMEAGRPRPTRRDEGVASPVAIQRRSPRSWLVPAILGTVVLAALAIWQPWKKAEPAPATRGSIEGAKPAIPLSEARKLADQARALLVRPGGAASKFDTAALLCDRALALDPVDAEVWAVASQIDTRMWFHSFDRTERRSESARSKAAKALNLAPASFEARLAHATFLVLVAGRPLADQAEPVLRTLRQENPREFRVLDILGQLLAAQGKFEESVACNDEASRLPGGAVTALMQKAWTLAAFRRIAEADAALDQSIAVQPISGNITLRVFLDLGWHGDPDRALVALRKLPADEMAEDNGISAVVRVYRWRREPAELLNFLNTVPRDWLTWGITGPKAAVTGDANAELGKLAAAREDWRQALTLVEQRLAGTPNAGDLLEWKAYLLASLGEKAKARETYQRSLEAPAWRRAYLNIEKLDRLLSPEELCDELKQRIEGAIEGMERGERPASRFVSAADLRLNPAWDGIRNLPRFRALQARLDADPRFNPKAGSRTAEAALKADDKSVAVLAFANLSDDKGNEYFSDGISEELLNVLAKVPGLKVSARTSAFHFKGKDTAIPEIAKQLGVAYVVEGSVRKQGDKVRITAQLIKAGDGFHVWSDTFTRDLKDIFAVQDEIAGLIAKNLQLKMGMISSGMRRMVSPDAYEEYLTGRALATAGSVGSMKESIAHFRRAVEIDPEYTAAWVQIARSYVHLSRWGGLLTTAEWDETRRAAARAVELEPASPDALLALGWVRRTADWNWKEAEIAFREALRLRPDHAETLAGLGVLLANLGREQESVALAQRAAALDPLNAGVQMDLLVIFYCYGRYPEAVQAGRRAIALAPSGVIARSWLARSHIELNQLDEAEAEIKREENWFSQNGALALLRAKQGRIEEARTLLRQMEAKADSIGGAENSYAYLANVWSLLGDAKRGMDYLEKTRAIRDPSIAWARTIFYGEALKNDPRWPEFLRSVGLSDDQLK